MPRLFWVRLLALGLTLAAAPASSAPRIGSLDHQTIVTAHLGVSSPTGDFADFADAGIGFGGSIGYGVSDRVMISLGIAHHNFDTDFSNVDASIMPFTLNADYAIPAHGKITPWVGGGIGAYNVSVVEEDFFGPGLDREDDETNFGINLGAGLAGPISRNVLLGGGVKYHFVSDGDVFDDSPFFTFQIGLGFRL